MSQEALLKAVEEDARLESERLVTEARKEARRLVTEAGREVSEARSARLKALSIEIEKMRTARINEARVRTGALKLKARLGVMEEAFRRAEKKVEEMPRERYRALILRLYGELKERWREAGLNDDYTVTVNPADARIIKEAGQEVKTDPEVRLGVVFTSADGRIRFENTIPSRIRMARPGLIPGLERVLFG